MDEAEDLFDIDEVHGEDMEKNGKLSVFRDCSVLDPRYTPSKLIARDDQIRAVASLFRPIFRGSVPYHAMIHGLPGTGKSVVLKYVTDHLNRALIKRKSKVRVNLISVPCNESGMVQILRNILFQLSPDLVPKKGLSISSYIGEILAVLNETGESLILALEEFDKIPRPEILYPLVRAYEQGTLNKGSYLSVIGVLNDLSFYSSLDPRILSSMGAQTIGFDPYSAPELIEVLEGRRHAFRPGALDDEIIPYCAGVSAMDRGDAREAIRLLKKAGELADTDSAPIVNLDYVKKAKILLDVAPDHDTINALPPLHKWILCAYLILKEEGTDEIWTGDLYQKYIGIVLEAEGKVVTRGRFSSTLSGMEMAGVIQAEQKNKGRGGVSRLITLSPMVRGIREVLMQDPQFRPLLEPAGGI